MTIQARDFAGYRGTPPRVNWPNNARVAVSFVVNLEEGAELAIADGDERNEKVYEAIEEVVGAPDPCMMSHFEYGTRAGYWRIMEVLGARGLHATISSCGRAVARSPGLVGDAVARGHEISCHGYRWETHAGMNEDHERAVIARAVEAIAAAAGRPPVGWHTRSAASVNTRRLICEHGGFLYDSDAYNDDLPFVLTVAGAPHVVLPYSFDTNDMRFGPGGGFVFAEDFARYCADAFDRLWEEGASTPKMMSVGLHLRFIGRPARIRGLQLLLDHIARKGGAWIARRDEIAHHWRSAVGLDPWMPREGRRAENAAE
ncbi:MAG: polysaccharide deacetylase family protein [Rhodospirillales bacterium]|jgi:peptidoglycan/xylan/chitin deacetylase (PgdA/CDA1 family)|nr:polysaccharide deacetylase family protein [Rhodospirillales bacterium]